MAAIVVRFIIHLVVFWLGGYLSSVLIVVQWSGSETV